MRWSLLFAFAACTPSPSPIDAGVEAPELPDASTPLLHCSERALERVRRFDGVLGGDTLMVGDGVVMSWSHHHYTAPIFGSEVWWPWCLVGSGVAWCASSSPWRVVELGVGAPIDVLADARPMAGTWRDGVLVGADQRLWRVAGDAGVRETAVVLPEPWIEPMGVADLERGAIAPPAMKSGERLVWISQRGVAFVTSLVDGTSTELGEADAVAVSDQLVASARNTSLSVNGEVWPVERTRPSLAAVGPWVWWLDGDVARARSLDGGTRAQPFDAGLAALTTEACDVYALTDDGVVWRFSVALP